ncbi:VENN motif pre-toxin domain-containing protein [Pseudomonas asiatica]
MAHAVLGAVVAQAQGNSAAAGAAGAAGGELVARLITQQLYGTSDSNSLSEEQKQTVSALSTLAAGLSGGLAEGNSAGAVAGAGAGRNAVENNLLANKYGVERLDAASRALYEKLKAAGIGSIDELHERYKACGGNGGCEVGIRDEYRQQEKQAGEKLVELYQSGRLSKAEYDLLVTDYALAMMRGGVDAQKSDADASFLDVYALSGSDRSPMGVVANPYVNAIRASELIAEWRRQGLTEEAINERARQDGLLGSTLAAVDVPGIISLVDKGATRDDVVKLAAVVILGKATSGAKDPTRFIDGVKVVDQKTGNVLQGTVDLGPTIDRIKSGGSFPHRNDGSIFQNRGGDLPQKPAGYYKEYVHPTPGVSGPGPQRIVVGKGGEMYYTADHYKTFIPVNK